MRAQGEMALWVGEGALDGCIIECCTELAAESQFATKTESGVRGNNGAIMTWKSKKLFNEISSYAQGKRVLDIGCGNKAYSSVSNSVVTLDAWPAVEPDVLIDLEDNDLPFEANSFDCILMVDFIEHLSKERGERIIDQSKAITTGRIYLLTPQWWDSNEKHTNNPKCWAYKNQYNLHKSFWPREEFSDWTEIGHKSPSGHDFFWGYWERSGD